jgi:hypothetical protein
MPPLFFLQAESAGLSKKRGIPYAFDLKGCDGDVVFLKITRKCAGRDESDCGVL